jgi:hypothetical protein
VDRCYSCGPVSGDTEVGGLIGAVGNPGYFSGSASLCFWDTQTSGQAQSVGGVGRATAEMQTVNTFLQAHWDFVGETVNGTEDIWWIDEGQDYPRLWWERQESGLTAKN